MPYAIIYDPELPGLGGKIISIYKTQEQAQKKARYSNMFKVIEVDSIKQPKQTLKSEEGQGCANQKDNS